MSHAIKVGSTNPIMFFRAFDTDGTAKVDLTSTEAGLSLSVYRTGGSSVAISSLSDKAADDTAHADGAIRQVGSGNLYTVDAPDAAVASQFGSVSIKGSYTAGVIEGVPHPLVGYDGATVAVGANTTTPPTSAAVADAVWDEALSGHNVAGSTGKAVRQLKEGVISVESSVNDASATTTTFVSELTETTDGFYHDKVIVFISGDLTGQARHIETYTGSTKSITVSQAFTSAPADADEFLILATHEHSLNEIADAVLDETMSGHTAAGSLGLFLNDQYDLANYGQSRPELRRGPGNIRSLARR